MTDPSWYCVLPPLLAIVSAITTRQVIPSLVGGIWLGYCLLPDVGPLAALAATIDGVIRVFAEPGDTRVIVFTLAVGGLIATIEHCGGVKGVVVWLQYNNWIDSPRRAQLLAWATGIVLFIESNITLLVAGAVSRPLFDRLRVSREKLAYLIDSTSAPICILIPFNAWGAVNLGLLSSTGVEAPLTLFLQAIPLNFYAITAVLLAGASILIKRDIGPMRHAEERTRVGTTLLPGGATLMRDRPPLLHDRDEWRRSHADKNHRGDAAPARGSAGFSEMNDGPAPRASAMIAPIAALVVAMLLALWITGNGDLAAGSGSTSVLWAVLFALAVVWTLSLLWRTHSLEQLMQIFLEGAGAMLPVALILLLSLALGDIAQMLRTGEYIATVVADTLPVPLLLPLIFVTSGIIAFSSGTSWGTFAIMIPIALPVATALGLPAAPFLGAVLSGAIFGDHASPISDTTIVASMAAATDHIGHVRTQLPYALLAGAISLAGFTLVAFCL